MLSEMVPAHCQRVSMEQTNANEISSKYTNLQGLFYLPELILTPTYISAHMLSQLWDEITYPFQTGKWLYHWNLGIEK